MDRLNSVTILGSSFTTMIDSPVVLLRRAREIVQTEGLWSLLMRSVRYVKFCIFTSRNYYLYEHSLRERNEADFLPDIGDFTLNVVRSNEEADRLAVDRGYDFRRFFGNARKCLARGAVAFCIFIGDEIACIGWVAMTRGAKDMFDPAPYHMDFSNGEASTGGTFTIPKYRGRGLMTYMHFKRLEYLQSQGATVSRNAVSIDNTVSQKVHAKFGPRIYARARYVRILWWKYLREMPFTKADP